MNYGINAVRYEYQCHRFILADASFVLNLLEEEERKILEQNLFA